MDVLCKMVCRPSIVALSWHEDECSEAELNSALLRMNRAPVLDEATCVILKGFHVNKSWDLNSHKHSITDLLPRSRPHLKTLSLRSCCIRTSLSMFSNIRELHILLPCVSDMTGYGGLRTRAQQPLQLDLLSAYTGYLEWIPFDLSHIRELELSCPTRGDSEDSCKNLEATLTSAVVVKLDTPQEGFGPRSGDCIAHAMATPGRRVRYLILTFTEHGVARQWMVSMCFPPMITTGHNLD